MNTPGSQSKVAANDSASPSGAFAVAGSAWRGWFMLAVGVMLLLTALGFAWKQAPHPNPWRPVQAWDVAKKDWWLYPVEQNAFKRLPVIQGDLNALHASPDGQKLWAAGNGGLIVHSPDGGKTWVQQHPRLDLVQPVPDKTAWSLLGQAWAADAPSSSVPSYSPSQKSNSIAPAIPQNNVAPPPIQQQAQEKKALQEPAPPAVANSVKGAATAKAPSPKPRPKAKLKSAKPPTAAAPAVNPTEPPLPPPDPERADLNAIHFIDDQHGWAVGDDGTILATRDGGKSWTPQPSVRQTSLTAVQFRDADTGWTVGDSGTILATRDGGRTWTPQSSGTQAQLTAVQFLNADTGWAVGDGGTILATRDGGKTWAPQPSETQAKLNAVLFRDADMGWAVGGSGTILSTRDGGKTWAQKSYTKAQLNAVQFTDPVTGWAIGENGTVLATQDGGNTWIQRVSSTEANLNTVRFTDTATGWAVGIHGTILGTHDGGKTWTPRTTGNRSFFTAVKFIDANTGWAVGRDGGILATYDGGKIWTSQTSSTGVPLGDVQFKDATTGWAVGIHGTILATLDGGKIWTSQISNTRIKLNGVQFTDAATGWVVGEDGNILATHDGGQTWVHQKSVIPYALNSVYFHDSRNGWIAAGDIRFGSGGILSTHDGGQSWVFHETRFKGWWPESVHFHNASTGWAVGRGSYTLSDGKIKVHGWLVLATHDGGQTWLKQTEGTGEGPSSIFFVDVSHGWVVGNDGMILATQNGGKTWTPQTSGTRAWLTAVQFHNAETGWAVGDGTILATRDGGKTWAQEARYKVFPAPWVYLLLALGTSLVLVAIRYLALPQETPKAPGVAELFVSDEPLGPEDNDYLGHDALTHGLANFILNRNTAPSLTLAVTASWGKGKSSIMRRLMHRLRKEGFRPAWFNAWHHQQEGRQLASMLNTIRQQAVPPWYSPKAWRVRGSLLWHRGLLYKLTFLAAAGLLVLAALEFPSMVRQASQVAGEASAQPEPFKYVVHAVRAKVLGNQVVLTTAGLEKLRKEAVLDQDALDAIGQHMLWAPKNAACKVAGGVCEFASQQELDASLEARIDRKLAVEEVTALHGATRHLGASPGTMLGVLLSALVVPLLLGKGLAIYGLNYFDILKRVLPVQGAVEGKEAVGTIEHFRDEFCRLTQALDERLVLFIDDLDRCECATVREVLELVNYLTSVGKCFVVLGVAMEHVAPCIPTRDGQADQKAYAEKYLKKLINIEVPIPDLDADTSQKLLQAQARNATRSADLHGVWVWAGRLGLFVLVMLMAWLMSEGWERWNEPIKAKEFITASEPRQSNPGSKGGVNPGSNTPAPPEQQEPPSSVGVDAAPPAHRAAVPVGLGSGLALALLIAFLWWGKQRWRYWLEKRGWLKALKVGLGGAARVEDSGDFVATLGIWHDVIALGDPNPRGIKRFVNRVRFLSMMESEQGEARIPDTLLVALSALHHAQVDVPENAGELADQLLWKDEHAANSRLRKAIHTALGKTQGWPPTQKQQKRFEQLVQGMYVR